MMWWDDDDDDFGEWIPRVVTQICRCWHYRTYGRCQHLIVYRPVAIVRVLEQYL
jgi:hypothetical protein